MKKQFTNEEQLLKFFMEKYKNSESNTVSIYKTDLASINLTESETIQSIHYLDNAKLIKIKERSVHEDLSRYWSIEILPHGIDYFKNKKLKQKEQNRIIFNEIRAWITLAIAIIALFL